MSQIAISSFKVTICDLKEFRLELEITNCDLHFFEALLFNVIANLMSQIATSSF